LWYIIGEILDCQGNLLEAILGDSDFLA